MIGKSQHGVGRVYSSADGRAWIACDGGDVLYVEQGSELATAAARLAPGARVAWIAEGARVVSLAELAAGGGLTAEPVRWLGPETAGLIAERREEADREC